MTQEFIEKHCVNCERCIFDINGNHHFYPYQKTENFIPMYCGEITEYGGYGTLLTELDFCSKIK